MCNLVIPSQGYRMSFSAALIILQGFSQSSGVTPRGDSKVTSVVGGSLLDVKGLAISAIVFPILTL
jgi:hypothetical protein